MHNIKNFITNIIKRCVITRPGKDNNQIPITQISCMDKVADCEIINPYGLYSNPPSGSLGIMFQSQGDEQNRSAIFNVTNNRFKNLEEGEVVNGNTITTANIKYDKDGNIIITSPNNIQVVIGADNSITIGGSFNLNSSGDATIQAPILHLKCNVVLEGTFTSTNGGASFSIVDGDIITSGDVVAQGVSLHDHVHGGVTSGGSNTSPPV